MLICWWGSNYKQTEVNGAILRFNQQLLTDGGVRRPLLDGSQFSTIDKEVINFLDIPFTKEEVLEAVKNMNRDKAPSLDGFSMAFFQGCWSIIKEDVMKVFHYFYVHGTFEKSINATFIVLIPKKWESLEIEDFYPISLVIGVYKLIAKVLANSLKVLYAYQNAFVRETDLGFCADS